MARERRRNRSEVPHEAMGLYLDSVASQNNLGAIALAGEDGLLVAGTRGDFDTDGLAAIGVAYENGVSLQREFVDTIARGGRLHASRLTISGTTFYLAVIGDKSPHAGNTVTALRRILGPALRTVAAA